MIKETVIEGGVEYTVEKYKNGNIRWYKKDTNILHRLNGPALINADGEIGYYIDNVFAENVSIFYFMTIKFLNKDPKVWSDYRVKHGYCSSSI